MTVSLAALVGALVVGILIPAQLERLCVMGIDPSVLIASWVLSITGVVVAGAAGVVLLLVPGHGVPGRLLDAVSSCWSSVRHGMSPRVEELSGLLGLLVLLFGAARFILIGVRLAARRARSHRERLAVLRPAARVESGSPAILWLAHDRPLAFSLPGRPGFLVATDGLQRQLTKYEAAAVLEHERAHIRRRHHLLVSLAEVSKSGLPFLPLFRAAPRAVRDLVELAADDSAARRCGAAAVRSALIRMAGNGSPGISLALCRDALDLRLDRLAETPRRNKWTRRTASCGLVAITPVLPIVAAIVFFAGVSVISCWNH